MLGLVYRFVDRRQLRKAVMSFLIMQMLTWSVGLFLVERRFSEYPVRLFAAATRQNFVSGYFIYPSLSVLYIQFFPENGRMKQFIYTAGYAAAITFWDYTMSAYTDLSNHYRWNPVHQFVLSFAVLLICRWLVAWIFKRHYPVGRES
jgi:hypothetical protein